MKFLEWSLRKDAIIDVMKRVLFIILALGGVFETKALTIHRSFRPTPIGTGGGTSVIAPGFTRRTGSQFQNPQTQAAPKKSLVGTVTQVADGDTIWVTPKGGSKTKVQLIRIDAPELDQPFGTEAKKFLADLILNKKVEVQYTQKDRTGCIGGVVFLQHDKGMVDVNLTLVLNGLAWHDDAADHTDAYVNGQMKARAAKIGLWGADDPVYPARWAKGVRSGK